MFLFTLSYNKRLFLLCVFYVFLIWIGIGPQNTHSNYSECFILENRYCKSCGYKCPKCHKSDKLTFQGWDNYKNRDPYLGIKSCFIAVHCSRCDFYWSINENIDGTGYKVCKMCHDPMVNEDSWYLIMFFAFAAYVIIHSKEIFMYSLNRILEREDL